jgi:putative hydrolase of the HAD superfamily
MQGIKNVIFDLGGVILNLDNRRTEAAFEAMGVKGFREYFGLGYAASFFKDYEVGKLTDAEFVAAIKQMADLKVTDQAVIDAWNALLLDFPPERINLLKELGKKYRLFLFSNTNSLHLISFQETYRRTYGDAELDDLFERAYYSHVLGLRKPGAESYAVILKENNLLPGETLFVDDALVNVEGAETLGIRGLHLKPGLQITDLEW